MATISDLRLVTLLPTENQTIYAFNVNNLNEYYTESFFAKMGTTWCFCVVPDRNANYEDCFITIIQSDNQTITVNTIIPDLAIKPELRAGILNYYSENLADKYNYTIGYQDIRVFTTAVEKSSLEVEYKYIEPIQVDHQLILIVDNANTTYSFGVNLAVGSRFKAVLIAEAGYSFGDLIVDIEGTAREEGEEIEPLPHGEIYVDYVRNNTKITATPASELFTRANMKVDLFDNSTTDHSNSDGYIDLGIGTEVKKETQTVLLYTKNKIDGECVQIGTDPIGLLYAAVGDIDNPKASRLIYRTDTQRKFLLKSIEGYYGYDYILGYSQAMKGSNLDPKTFNTNIASFTINGFGFCAEHSPVNDATEGYWFLIIENPGSDRWTYIKFVLLKEGVKVFTMYAYREYFEEITKGNFAGQLMYKQGSRDGINDSAYLFLQDAFVNKSIVSAGVYII